MRLSIGIPAYNQGSFLRQTLDSLLAQTRPFDEIVVSNNHSTDSTAEVLATFERQHPGILRTVVPPHHLTSVQNWNFAARQLSGDWISLISSDDLARPNYAADVHKTIQLSPRATILRAAWREMTPDGSPGLPRLLSTCALVTPPARALYEQRLGPKASFAAFSVRRDIFAAVGGFPEETQYIGDWGLWLLAGALGDTVLCRSIIADYRLGHHASSVNPTRRRIEMQERFAIYSNILPRATRLAGLGEPAWIARSSRESFRRRIVALSRDFAPDTRADLARAIQPWAEALGSHEQRMLERFTAGDVLPTHSYLYSLSRFFLPPLRRLRSALRS